MVRTAAVIGAGLMGRAISRHLASAGLEVTLVDSSPGQLALADRETPDSVTCRDSLAGPAADAIELVIEAVYEDLALKQQVLADIERTVSRDCIIATNTSSLLVSDISRGLEGRDRFLGIHFNNPADINPIVEVIGTAETEASLVTRVRDWMAGTGKTAIVCADTSGFILNRQSLPYINEAARLIALATPGQIDGIARSALGTGLGPFAVMNLVGTPVMAAASRNLAILGPGYEAAGSLQERAASDDIAWLIEEDSSPVDTGTAASIQARLTGAMIFPGRDILNRGLCSRDDLHQICIEALGYARSSPELLETLPAPEIERYISAYLAH